MDNGIRGGLIVAASCIVGVAAGLFCIASPSLGMIAAIGSGALTALVMCAMAPWQRGEPR